MITKRPLSALSIYECQAVRAQWLRSGKCRRCFHASLRSRAEDEPNRADDQGTPLNAPNNGRTREQHAARESEEVKMIQRDLPSPSLQQTDPNTLRPPGAGQTVDPEAIGLNVGKGSMGQNDSASQEGVHAQGVDMTARTDVDSTADARATRGTGQPVTVESISERHATGLERGPGTSTGDALTGNEKAIESLRRTQRKGALKLVESELVAGSTIAAGNFEGVIKDRLNSIAEAGQQDHDRTPARLALKLRHNQLVRFESPEEKAAVLEEVKKLVAAKTSGNAESAESQPEPEEISFAPLPQRVRETIIDQMVAGKYKGEDLLSGKAVYQQLVLNDVARATIKNGTYLSADRERFLAKVRSLLPAAKQTEQQKES